MAYKRKTQDVFELWVNYGQGWEYEIAEFSRKDINQRVKEYAENCPQYSTKVKTRRELISVPENTL